MTRPYGQGRTARLTQRPRLSPGTVELLAEIQAALNISLADWIEQHASDDAARLAMCRLGRVEPTADVVMRGKVAVVE